MSPDVSRFVGPLHLSNPRDLRALRDADMHSLTLGTPFIVDRRRYRIEWDKTYACAYLKPLSTRGEPLQRDRQEERAIARGLDHQLRGHLVKTITAGELRAVFSHKRLFHLEHVAAGGLLKMRGRASEKTFAVVVDKRGKAAWSAIDLSRWPTLRALRDFFAGLTERGRRVRRERRNLLRELDAFLPAAQVKTLRESILSRQASATSRAAARNPAAAHAALRERIANPRAVMQFLRDEPEAVCQQDGAKRTIAHHVACTRSLQDPALLDLLFVAAGCAVVGVSAVPVMLMADDAGNTPLHHAVMHGDKVAVRRFLQEAARLGFDFASVRNRAGRTVWDCAVERQDARVLEVVRQFAGAPSPDPPVAHRVSAPAQ